MSRVGTHCPTKFATWRLPAIIGIHEIAMAPSPSDRYVPDGSFAIWDSISVVTLPSPSGPEMSPR